MFNKILFFSFLVLNIAACGPQLTAKEKEDIQAKAYYEDDIRSLEPFIGNFEGKILMKRSGRIVRGKLSVVAFIGSTSKNKASVQATLSVYEQQSTFPFYDFNYISNEVVAQTLYLSNNGAPSSGTGSGGTAGATMVLSSDKSSLVMESFLFRFDAKRVVEKRR